ncbi:MAG: hypothetical protein JWO82_1103 [Akkermansiaceae bacterium]|nr:hypothetical protein [Akkermansiaceae bacterium]
MKLLFVTFFAVWLSQLHAQETKGSLPREVSVTAHVTLESVFGAKASIFYFITNNSDVSQDVFTEWIYDSGRMLEVKSSLTGEVFPNQPGGLFPDESKKKITLSPKCTIILVGPVPINDIFLKRKEGSYAITHAIFGDVIYPFALTKKGIEEKIEDTEGESDEKKKK